MSGYVPNPPKNYRYEQGRTFLRAGGGSASGAEPNDDKESARGWEVRGNRLLAQICSSEFRTLAIYVRPAMTTKTRLRTLAEFLRTELEVTAIYLYRGEIGSYAQVDLESLQFC